MYVEIQNLASSFMQLKEKYIGYWFDGNDFLNGQKKLQFTLKTRTKETITKSNNLNKA